MDFKLKDTIVIDDLLSEEDHNKYHDLVMRQPWRFIKDMSYANHEVANPSYGFNNIYKHPDHGIVSALYETVCVPIVNELLKKTNLTISDINYTRSFLQLPLASKFIKERNGIHIDIPQDHYACVYYLNDSDGDTIIYEQTKYDTPGQSQNVMVVEHKRVKPKKGRMVIFDGARYHCSSQPTENYRCIINFDLI